jgi:hypothetical protein
MTKLFNKVLNFVGWEAEEELEEQEEILEEAKTCFCSIIF